MPEDPKDLSDRKALRSRMKLRGLHHRALGERFQAARYFRAAYELEDEIVERYFLAAEAALLDLEALEKARPDLAGSMARAWERLLEDHSFKKTKRSSK